jgi:dTDP-glucose 4,6-dehydratase
MNKIGMPILHPEQYLIADAQYVLDTGGTKEALGWKPKHSDTDMLVGAYEVYRKQGNR